MSEEKRSDRRRKKRATEKQLALEKALSKLEQTGSGTHDKMFKKVFTNIRRGTSKGITTAQDLHRESQKVLDDFIYDNRINSVDMPGVRISRQEVVKAWRLRSLQKTWPKLSSAEQIEAINHAIVDWGEALDALPGTKQKTKKYVNEHIDFSITGMGPYGHKRLLNEGLIEGEDAVASVTFKNRFNPKARAYVFKGVSLKDIQNPRVDSTKLRYTSRPESSKITVKARRYTDSGYEKRQRKKRKKKVRE